MLLDLGDARRKYLEIIKQYIDYLDAHIKKENTASVTAQKSLYSFDDLHELTKKITDYDQSLSGLQAKKDEAQIAINRINNSILSYDRQLKDVEYKIQALKSKEGNIKEDIILFDLEKEVALIGKTCSSLQIDMNKKSIQFIEFRLSVIQNKLHVLKNDLNAVRMHLRIDITDVAVYEQKYNEIKRDSQIKKLI